MPGSEFLMTTDQMRLSALRLNDAGVKQRIKLTLGSFEKFYWQEVISTGGWEKTLNKLPKE